MIAKSAMANREFRIGEIDNCIRFLRHKHDHKIVVIANTLVGTVVGTMDNEIDVSNSIIPDSVEIRCGDRLSIRVAREDFSGLEMWLKTNGVSVVLDRKTGELR